MKKLIALTMAVLTVCNSFAATVSINVADILGQPTSAVLTFSPRSTPGVYNPSLIISGDKSVTTGTNGLGSIVLVPGDYMLKITGRPLDNRMVSVGTNSTYALIDIITNALVYTNAVSPVYVLKSDFANAGDLLTKQTNGQVTNLTVGTHGQYMIVDTNSPYKIGWTNAVGGLGTVTSIGITSSDLDVTGSPVTTSGNITLGIKASVLSPYLLSATAASTYQPLDSDLTSIAALSTTTYGRSLLTLADAAAGRSSLGLGTLATQNGTISDYATIASLGTAAYSNANAFTGTNEFRSWTNTLGTAAFQSVADFQPASSALTNFALLSTNSFVGTNTFQTFTNLIGTAGFSNAAAFQPANANLTNWALLSTNQLVGTNAFQTFTNSLGTAAFQSVAAFQPASLNLTNWSLLSTSSLVGTNDWFVFTNSMAGVSNNVYTITNSYVRGVAAGTGVTTSTNNGVVTVNSTGGSALTNLNTTFTTLVTNSGVKTISGGTNITLTDSTTNIVINYRIPSGSVLQYTNHWFSNTYSAALSTTTFQAIGWTNQFQNSLTSTNSKVKITGTIQLGTSATGNVQFRILRNGTTDINTTGATNMCMQRMQAANDYRSFSFVAYDSPATNGIPSYTLQWAASSGTSATFYINRTSDAAQTWGTSQILLEEIEP